MIKWLKCESPPSKTNNSRSRKRPILFSNGYWSRTSPASSGVAHPVWNRPATRKGKGKIGSRSTADLRRRKSYIKGLISGAKIIGANGSWQRHLANNGQNGPAALTGPAQLTTTIDSSKTHGIVSGSTHNEIQDWLVLDREFSSVIMYSN